MNIFSLSLLFIYRDIMHTFKKYLPVTIYMILGSSLTCSGMIFYLIKNLAFLMYMLNIFSSLFLDKMCLQFLCC